MRLPSAPHTTAGSRTSGCRGDDVGGPQDSTPLAATGQTYVTAVPAVGFCASSGAAVDGDG
ncbi:MAG: hypothetical protein Q7T55_23345, partial [Solirubrobacteraceae bacterium]|nr:hypothetical protein [Solirubrobacteraceae bacterium]